MSIEPGAGLGLVFLVATLLVIVAIAVVVGVVIIALLRALVPGRRPEDVVALGILKERLARGEITQDEYERVRRVLER